VAIQESSDNLIGAMVEISRFSQHENFAVNKLLIETDISLLAKRFFYEYAQFKNVTSSHQSHCCVHNNQLFQRAR